ncbi:protein disulfide-isomerase A4-like [Limulus polyphemus]|uniref:Protein disulfide-isomerase n=1 Tax=Limulus polyphemus TaxID=6850 RepID=A0ABM1SC63_LIMPO|nr:protein disulfide-isomerase A4-like [Limulus polyphemus]
MHHKRYNQVILCILYLSILFKTCVLKDVESESLEQEEGILQHVKEPDDLVSKPSSEAVITLTSENITSVIKQSNIILVEFYAPWCVHCQTLEPEYEQAAKALKENNPPVILAKVDGTVEEELIKTYKVTAYPTMIFFRQGQEFPYEGPREWAGIVKYMKERADPNWKPSPEAVITLTNENFTSVVNQADLILVEFYAPWCGACTTLAPEYEKAAIVMKENTPPVTFAKVDCSKEGQLLVENNVSAFPTLYIFRWGRQYPYEGGRNKSSIIEYMKEESKPPSKEAKTVKALENYKSKKDVNVIGFFRNEKDNLYKEYLLVADEKRRKFNFLHTFSENIAVYYKVTVSTIVLFQPEVYHSKYEESKFEFKEIGRNGNNIEKFLMKHSVPLVGQRTRKNLWLYQNNYPLVVVYYDVDFGFENIIRTQLVRKEVVQVAKDYKGQITFAICHEEEFAEELRNLGLDDSGEDVNAGFFMTPKQRYSLEPIEAFSAEELKKFIETVLSGKLPAYIKSEPAPKSNTGPVYTIVGSTFDKFVTTNDKDVVLQFCDSLSSSCHRIDPIYKKLAKKFIDHKSMMFGKFDAKANDFPEIYDISDYPSIFYISAKEKDKPIKYSGEITLNNLIKFVRNNTDIEDDLKQQSKDEL